MFENTWNSILDWFRERSERSKLIRQFNESARLSFINLVVPTLLKASISRGDSAFKHQFSHWLKSGFRIQTFQGRQLSRDELIVIGKVILSDETLVRKMIVLGFDTLEVCCDVGNYGCKWQLKAFLQIE